MTRLACSTSVTPGSWTRIWSLRLPVAAITGSATPSALTRRSSVRIASCTVWSRRLTFVEVGHPDVELAVARVAHLPVVAEEVAQQVAHVLGARGLDALDGEGGGVHALHGRHLDPLARSLVTCRRDRVVDGRGEGLVDHHLQHEVDPAAQVEAEVDLARLAAAVVRRPDGDAARQQERAVDDRLPAQLRAHEGVDEPREGEP